MAQDSNESVPYLAALKRFAGPETADTTSATAAESSPHDTADAGDREDTRASFSGVEKRRSSRFKCEGSAEIREDGRDVRTWAAFTDVSIHGCYVEAQATYPAGTVLQMKLDAKGVKIEAKCTVRVNYPYLGMGIAFVEMTDENRVCLRRLLGIVAQPESGPQDVTPSSVSKPAVASVSHPDAAVQALISYFETRHMLTREDFLGILNTSQSSLQTRFG